MSNKILNRLVNLKCALEKSILDTHSINNNSFRTLTIIKQPDAQLQKQTNDNNKAKLQLLKAQKRSFNLRNDALSVSQEEVSKFLSKPKILFPNSNSI